MTSLSPITINDFEESTDSEKSLRDWINVFKRRKWSLVITAVSLIVIAALIALLLPAKYRSTATILIEQQEIPQDFVRSTITTFADQRLQVIQQRVMTSSNLFEIINKYDLYQDLLETEPREVVLEVIRDAISMKMISAEVIDPRSGRPVEATIAFNVSFEHGSPGTSLKVANELYSLFLDENIKQRTQKALDATLFLQAEANKLEKVIAELDEQLAVFKKGNVENLPELNQMNLNLINRTDDQINSIDQQLRALKERKIYLETELVQMDPDAGLFDESGSRLLGSSDRLKLLRTQLSQLTGIYTDDHPDIVRIRKEITALEADIGDTLGNKELKSQLRSLQSQLEAAELKYSVDHPDVKSLKRAIASIESEINSNVSSNSLASLPSISDVSNPAFSNLMVQLEATNAEIDSLNISRAAMQNKILGLERRLLEAPEVERKYRTLARDYETAQAKFRDVKIKLSEAKIGQALEAGNQAEKFTLIEQPLLPQRPISPNRKAIFLIGIFLGLLAGVVLAILKESLDDAVYDRASIYKLTGLMPLAVLPTVNTEKEIIHNKRKKWLIWLALFLIAAIALIAIHVFHTPLDILYYKILRKI